MATQITFLPYLDKYVVIFINVISIYCRSYIEHGKHLRVVQHKNLYVKLSKWVRVKELKFLGDVESNEGISVGPSEYR